MATVEVAPSSPWLGLIEGVLEGRKEQLGWEDWHPIPSPYVPPPQAPRQLIFPS